LRNTLVATGNAQFKDADGKTTMQIALRPTTISATRSRKR
jgi:hypothetical protein